MMDVGRIDAQEPVTPAFVGPEPGEELPDVDVIEATAMARGLAKGIVTVCEVLEIPLDEARLAVIESLDVGGLERLLDTLAEDRHWP
jgi:hypothetical protein